MAFAGRAGAPASCSFVVLCLAVCFLDAFCFDTCFLGAWAGFSAIAAVAGVAEFAGYVSAARADRLNAPTIVAATREVISFFIIFSRVIKSRDMPSRIASACGDYATPYLRETYEKVFWRQLFSQVGVTGKRCFMPDFEHENSARGR